MMSLAYIQHESDKAARRAAKLRKQPYVPFDLDEVESYLTEGKGFPFPNIGSHRPRNWQITDQVWFVDSTGHGGDNEPALTHQQFKRELLSFVSENPTMGYAIIEVGQFQLYIAAFEPVV